MADMTGAQLPGFTAIGGFLRVVRRKAMPLTLAGLCVTLLGALSIDIGRADLAKHRLENAMGAACEGMVKRQAFLDASTGEWSVGSFVTLHLMQHGIAPMKVRVSAAAGAQHGWKSTVEMPTRAMSLFGADRMTIAVEVSCGSNDAPTLAWTPSPEV
jgi:Putative Flp pilus-assembly TadE/G-like